MSYFTKRAKRIVGGSLVGALALSVSPILGLTGIASAADPLPPVADPIGAGNFCEDAPTTEPFTDVQPSDSAYEEIVCLVGAGITSGTTPTTYTPAGNVTRRQMALFIKRSADLASELEIGAGVEELPAYDGTTAPFTDIGSESAEAQEAIGQLQQAGIVSGTTATTFTPGANVTRRQMAAFINNLQAFLTGTAFPITGDYFDDDNGDSGEDNLDAVAGAGIFQGDGTGNVFPGNTLSRRQMASVILRYMQTLLDDGLVEGPFGDGQDFDVLPNTPAFNTVSTTTGPDIDRGSRTFTADVGNATVVDIALMPATGLLPTTPSGDVIFPDVDSDQNRADGLGQTNALIETVNGVPSPGAPTDYVNNVGVTGGTVTFTVDSTVPNTVVIPVVFTDADNNNQLNLNEDNTPSEPYGVGGITAFFAVEAGFGLYTDVEVIVDLVDLIDLFTGVDNGTDNLRFNVQTGDQFKYSPLLAAPFLSNGEFEAHLSGVSAGQRALVGSLGAPSLGAIRLGDRVDVQYAAEGPSVFDIDRDAPNAVTAVTAVAADSDTDGSTDDALVTWTAPANFRVDGYAVYQRFHADDQPFTAWTGVGVVKGKANTEFNHLNQSPLSGTRTVEYLVVAYNHGDDFAAVPPGYDAQALPDPTGADRFSPDSTPASAVLAPAPAADRPVSRESLFTNGPAQTPAQLDVYDAGDSFSFTFDGPITVAAGAVITLVDDDGSINRVTNGVNGTFVVGGLVNQILTVTLTGPPTVVEIGSTNFLQTANDVAVLLATGVGNTNGDWNLPESGRYDDDGCGPACLLSRTRVVGQPDNGALPGRPLDSDETLAPDVIVSNDNSFESSDANNPEVYVNPTANTLRIKPGASGIATGDPFFVYDRQGVQIGTGTYDSAAGTTVSLSGDPDYGQRLYLVRRNPVADVLPSATTVIVIASDTPAVLSANGVPGDDITVNWVDNNLSPLEPVGITQTGPPSNYTVYNAANNVLIATGEAVTGSPTGPGSPGDLLVDLNANLPAGVYTLRVAPNTVQDPNNLPNLIQVRTFVVAPLADANPTIAVTSGPANGATILEDNTVYAGTASDDNAVTAVQAQIVRTDSGSTPGDDPDVTVKTFTTPPNPAGTTNWSFPLTGAQDGTYVISFRSVDNAGQFSTVVTRTVTVNADAPIMVSAQALPNTDDISVQFNEAVTCPNSATAQDNWDYDDQSVSNNSNFSDADSVTDGATTCVIGSPFPINDSDFGLLTYQNPAGAANQVIAVGNGLPLAPNSTVAVADITDPSLVGMDLVIFNTARVTFTEHVRCADIAAGADAFTLTIDGTTRDILGSNCTPLGPQGVDDQFVITFAGPANGGGADTLVDAPADTYHDEFGNFNS